MKGPESDGGRPASREDVALRRLERTALVCCLAAAAAALGLGGPGVALGVLGGGLLAGLSYWAIRRGVEALVAASEAEDRARHRRRAVLGALVFFAGRYALLAFLAYVMIARLRLHPIGLVAGATSVVAAAVVEAARLLVTSGTRRRD